MKRTLFLLTAVPSLLAAQATVDTAARPISLNEAVTLAQRNSPTTIQARNTTRVNAAAVTQARAAFLPSLTTSLSAGRSGGDRFDSQGQLVPQLGQAWSYGSGLSLNLELFDGGRRLYELKAAGRNVDAAEANEILQRYNVALSVKQQYFNVLAARESDAAARTQLEQAQAQLRAASARVSAGAATRSDSLRSVIQVQNALLALLTAENNLRVANASLTRLVATPFTVTASNEVDELSGVGLDSAQLAQLALNGPAVQQAEAALVAARASRRSSRTSYWPSISASMRRNGNGFDSKFGWGDERYAYTYNAGLSLNFTGFDRLNREVSVVRAKVAEDNAEAELRDAKLLAHQNFVQYLGALRTAEQRVQIQQSTVANAEEDLRVQQQRYTLGASTLLEFLTSQSTLNGARADLIRARYDARVARAQIEALIGRDLQ